MRKHPASLLIGGIIAAVLLFFLFDFMNFELDEALKDNTAASLGTLLGLTYMVPFRTLMVGGTIFCWIACLFSFRWAAIVAGVLFAVSMIILPRWMLVPLVPMILCFVGASKLKPTAEEENNDATPKETSLKTES